MMGASKIRRHAIRWLIRVQTTRDLEGLWPDFDAWINEDPKHREAYELEERKWVGLDALPARSAHHLTPEALMRAAARARWRREVWVWVGGALAACCVVLAIAVLIGSEHGRVEAHTWVPYATDADPPSPVMLEDGSVLQLNAHSQARTRLTDAVREVALDTGEAYFDVSPEHARHFNVWAGSVLVEATGTAFSVKKEDNGRVETTVRRGSVEVKSASSLHPFPGEAGRQAQKLGPGDAATIGPSGEMTVVRVDPEEMAHRLAWANRVIDLHGTLGEAVAQFNHYNVRKLVILEADLAKTRIRGRFRITEPDAFAESLNVLGIKHVAVGPEASSEGRIQLSRNED